ncbi:hypothetical protein BDQ94DRAFT_164581 [Aspergillus welwitschiae]|uniref:Uncharacterized protein n=1 Tax=Aspergillus welwitschiae TaxID=1341132 RepID=A0A3F3PHD6_9EURO|nr:hypothetical protein BDQ94DRAFT_164581 [Aspergillus welwitschiae]RDH26319.1 hypothetical protein BDQ94DRAFT_164581 [Aspergillus welwitschiae]
MKAIINVPNFPHLSFEQDTGSKTDQPGLCSTETTISLASTRTVKLRDKIARSFRRVSILP